MQKSAALLAFALACVVLAACGGEDSTATPRGGETNGSAAAKEGTKPDGGGSTLRLETVPRDFIPSYTTTKAAVKAGQVTIDFNNPQREIHNVAIEDSSGETIRRTEFVAEEEISTTVNLSPGKYVFFCTVAGHRYNGMKGTLTVK
jgi:plastocyanin